jgi:hypothetical protein
MADTMFYTQEAANKKCVVLIANLALSKLRLVKGSFLINTFTTKAQLVANEADFDGYTPGGYTLTAWTGPLIAGGGGAVMSSPLVVTSYNTPSDPPVTNSICGWWAEDAAGVVRVCGNFAPARPMAQVGDGWPMLIQIIEGFNMPAP